MLITNKKIDEYINRSADFAKPILNHLRNMVHTTCPDVIETIKWSFPNFVYAGGILCSMAAFKQHCSFGFWLGSLMKDPKKLLEISGEKTSMGHLGQLKSLDDLPPDAVLVKYIREAMTLNEKGAKAPKKEKVSAKEIEVPSYFSDVLKKNLAASEAFEKFSPSHKREYIEWITEAKTEATRNKRIETALQWLTEGKPRNWKYSNC